MPSAIVIDSGPGGTADGTVKVAVKSPLAVTPPLMRPIGIASALKVTEGIPPWAKPEPKTVTAVPTGPLLG